MEKAVWDECMEMLAERMHTPEMERRVDALVDTVFCKLRRRMLPFVLVSSSAILSIVLLTLYTCFNVQRIRVVPH